MKKLSDLCKHVSGEHLAIVFASIIGSKIMEEGDFYIVVFDNTPLCCAPKEELDIEVRIKGK